MRPVTGTPALTMRETRLGAADKGSGRHWSHAACWCEARHEGGGGGLTLVPPPWDASRDGERAA